MVSACVIIVFFFFFFFLLACMNPAFLVMIGFLFLTLASEKNKHFLFSASVKKSKNFISARRVHTGLKST